jgi:hypothetical protein
MKKIFFVSCLFAAISSFAQTTKPTRPITTKPKPVATAVQNTVPESLITNDSTFWTISTMSGVNYVTTTPGAYYGTTTNGGGMLIKFKFLPNNRFAFQLYVEANGYGTRSTAWTEAEGSVIFTKDTKGQDIFITKADKGTYRTMCMGVSSSRAIPKNELEGRHSSAFIWQKTTFNDDPNNIYLLLVDLKEHPDADVNKAGTIKPEWVSKFHIPAR